MEDLYTQILEKTNELNISIKELRNSGTKYAQAEKDYKICLMKECLKLRDEKMPVTLIDKICYGVPAVAELRFKRDVAEAVYKANLESINGIKLQLRLLENQLQREFGANLSD